MFFFDNDVIWYEYDWLNLESWFIVFIFYECNLGGGDLYVVFNLYNFLVLVEVLVLFFGKYWVWVVDMNLLFLDDFCDEGKVRVGNYYEMSFFFLVVFYVRL